MRSTSIVRLSRQYHRVLAWIVALPLLVIFTTGALLLLRHDVAWIQPPEMKGTGHELALPLEKILEIAKSVPEANVSTWKDVARLEMQPKHALIKLRTTKKWELQIDAGTGKILNSYYRKNGLIASLHDGTFFGEKFSLYVNFPIAVLSILTWLSGAVLLIFPYFYRL